MLTEDLVSDVPEPVDVVWTGLSFEASKMAVSQPKTQESGIWHVK